MAQSPRPSQDHFQVKTSHFELPEYTMGLAPQKKRGLTICNLFVNHGLSVSNIETLLEEDAGKVVLTLIEHGIVQDRRQKAGHPPLGIERRLVTGKSPGLEPIRNRV